MIIATNIRLKKEQWQTLKMKAVLEGTSASALVRKAIDQLVRVDPPTLPPSRVAPVTNKKRKKKDDPFFLAIGLGSGGPSDDSTDHDQYLYHRK